MASKTTFWYSFLSRYLLEKAERCINMGVRKEDGLEERKGKRILNVVIWTGICLVLPARILVLLLLGSYSKLWADAIIIVGCTLYYYLLLQRKNWVTATSVLTLLLLILFVSVGFLAKSQEPVSFMLLLLCLGLASYFPKGYRRKYMLILLALGAYFALHHYHSKYLPFSEAHALGLIPMLLCYFFIMLFIDKEQARYQQTILSQKKELSRQNELLAQQHAALKESQRQEKILLQELLDEKERALTSQAMQASERHQTLTPLVKRLSELARQIEGPLASEASAIRKVMQEHLDSKSWAKFLFQFEKVHPRFFEQLKAKHPILTANDLKVCSYLKTGLANQEIAQAIHITPASMKKNLNRLKKKLGLGPEDDLREYLMAI